MSCMFGNGYCACCENFVQTTDVTIRSNALVLTIPEAELTNGKMFCIQIAQDIPDISELSYVPNVAIDVENQGAFTVIQDVSCGLAGVPNNYYADQLAKIRCGCDYKFKPNQLLSVKFATDTRCFGYVGCRKPLPKSEGIYPLVVVASVEDTPVVEVKEKKATKGE